MAHITADRVRDTATTTGTGNFTVSGTAPQGYRTFSAVCSANDTFYYAIQHQTAAEWEVGLGTYSSANTLARTTVYASSASGSAVNFSAGTKDVFITLAATRTVQLTASGIVDLPASSTINGVAAVTTTGTQTLTNKTLTDPVISTISNTGTLTLPTSTDTLVGRATTDTLSNKTLVAPVALASSTTTQDGLILTGRAGGTSSYRVTIAPTTLSASRSVTMPDAAGVVVLDTATQTLTNKTLTSPTVNTATISGGTIDNTTIGGTTAVAGSFTTVSASTSVTTPSVTNTGTLALSATGANIATVSTNGSERLRIDSSGNVSIGTTSGGYKLRVNGTTYFENGTLTVAAGSVALSDGYGYSWGNTYITGYTGNYMSFTTNASERMRIDASGVLKVGTTAAFSGSAQNIVSSYGFASSQPYGTVGFNIFYDAATPAWRYSSNGTGAVIQENTGAITFANATSNSSGHAAAATLTERMRVTSDGNVLIGNTSGTNKLDITGSFGRGAPVPKTGDFTLAATENWIICNKASSLTVTLPAASSWTGREVMIKTITAQTVVSASSNVVPLAGGSAGTAILAATAGKWATLVSDGTNWIIMQAN